MYLRISVVVLAFGLLAAARAQVAPRGPPFPFNDVCLGSRSGDPRYIFVDSITRTSSPGEYCFKIKVDFPPICNITKDSGDWCCDMDLKKFEVHVTRECDVSGLKLLATLNGKPVRSVPTIDPSPKGGYGAMLRVNYLGLSMKEADGSVLCVQLSTNTAGKGCVTLEALCVPPEAGPRGSCNTVFYNEALDCCPTTPVTPFAPPPPLPPPPSPPPPSPPPPSPPPPPPPPSPPPPPPPPSPPPPPPPPSPPPPPRRIIVEPCKCNNTRGVTPFSVNPTYTTTTSPSGSTINCFTLASGAAALPSLCGATGNLLKMEFIADQSLSSYVKSISLYPKGDNPTTLSPSWNGPETNILKATPMSWTQAQANGGKVCVEVKAGKTMEDICGGEHCDMLLFNTNKKCCPEYSVAPGY